LNIAALPPGLPEDVLAEIMRGIAEKTREAGVVIAGGHTIQDQEPKVGLVVLGFVETARALTKGGVRPGDRLVLTKPLGFGVTTTAHKREMVSAADLAEAVDWMKRLNRTAALLALEFNLRGATDITGYSLIGHAFEMADASQVRLRLHYARLPFLTGAGEYARQWTFPGGAFDNRLFYGPQVQIEPGLSEAEDMLLFDPQTSGGLLLAVPEERLAAFLARASQLDQPAWVIGEALEGAGLEVIREG